MRNPVRMLALLLPWLVVGCIIDTSAVAPGTPVGVDAGVPVDASTPDVAPDGAEGPSDSGTEDAGFDTSAPPTSDGGHTDTAIADAEAEDATSSDTGTRDAPPASCDELYGDLDGYLLCSESDEECMFYVVLGGERSCDDACAEGAVPGVCAGSERNMNSSGRHRCTARGSEDCDRERYDVICICSRPQ